MKLDLKRLRAQPGERVTFVEQEPLSESDFHEPVTLHTPLRVDGWALWHPDHLVELSVTLRLELDQVCSRCLAPVPHRIELEEHTRLWGTPTPQLLPDAFSYEQGAAEVDLAPMFLGLLIGQLDPKPLCTPACKGLCPRCGADLNRGACACDRRPRRDPRLAVLERWLDG